jgi:hypothetical protein
VQYNLDFVRPILMHGLGFRQQAERSIDLIEEKRRSVRRGGMQDDLTRHAFFVQ